MRVLVCGGRTYGSFGRSTPGQQRYAEAFAERGIMCRALDAVRERMSLPIHGGATGADDYCAKWATDHGVSTFEYAAKWHKHGLAAGPIRNQLMIDEGKPDLVLAFPGGRGTTDMIRRARAAGVEVREIPAPPQPTTGQDDGGADG